MVLKPAASPRAVALAVASAGALSCVGQLVLLREVLVVSGGHELALGVAFVAWLLFVAAGSRVGAALPVAWIGPGLFAALTVALGLALTAATLAAPLLKAWSGIPVAEMAGPYALAPAVFLLSAPVGLMVGLQFVSAVRLTGDQPRPIGRAYGFEALGAAAGGAVFSLVLVPWLVPVANVLAFAGLASFAAAVVTRRRLLVGGLVALAGVGFWAALVSAAQLDRGVFERAWADVTGEGAQRIAARRDSRFGRLVVISAGGGYTFYNDRRQCYTLPATGTTEAVADLALLQTARPRRVALVGGLTTVLREALRYRPETVYVGEPDPAVIDLARQVLPPEPRACLDAPGVRVLPGDGRLAIKSLRGLDAVVVQAPDPLTTQFNRLYTYEFFRDVRLALTSSGVLALTLSSPRARPGFEGLAMHRSVSRTLQAVFDDVLLVPDLGLYLAAANEGRLERDGLVLARRYADVPGGSRVTGAEIERWLSPRSLDQANDILADSERAPYNRDFAPTCAWHGLQYEIRSFESSRSRKPHRAPLPLVALVGLAVTLLVWLLRGRGRMRSLAACVAAAGYGGLTLMLVLVFAFQAVYGCVYWMIGPLVTAFMAGLAGGALAGGGTPDRAADRLRARVALLALLLASTPLLLGLLSSAATSSGAARLLPVVFPVLAAVGGLLVGNVFPTAALRASGEPMRIGAVLYGADLLGAALAALVVSRVLLPMLGVGATCTLAALAAALGVLHPTAEGSSPRPH